MTIGVFDTGLGGEFVAGKLRRLIPEHSYLVVNDLKNAPYGDRTQAEIIALTDRAIQPIIDREMIIIACNTATAMAIDFLRQKYPNIKFVGFEPMIKTAAKISVTKHITLLATSATKQSSRLKQLTHQYADGMIIDMPDTTNWASLIDRGLIENIDLSEVSRSIEAGSDLIILGCTHYMALENILRKKYPDCQIIEPTEAVAVQIKRLASQGS